MIEELNERYRHASGGWRHIRRRPRTQFVPHTQFVYDGRLGELYWIFIKNILLMIPTLTIWRFWGKTRMRRYLWSHTSLAGDRFEYTGTGGELFIGFLIVMVIYVAASIGIQILAIFVEPDSPILIALQFGLLFVLLYLTFVAQYAAQRYRLTRTLWRGISGGMTGSAWRWGIKGMFFSFLSLLSLTLAWPWAQMRLIDDRLNNSYFGDAKASIQTSSKSLYLPYILGMLAVVVTVGMVGYLIYMMWELTRLVQQHMPLGINQFIGSNWFPTAADRNPNETIVGGVAFAVVMLIIGYLIVATFAILVFAAYYVAMAHEVTNKLALGGLRFATPLTPGAFISRYLGNVLIIVFTLGLGLPIAVHRTMLFLARNIEIIGEIDGSEITRADLPRPKFGEGLLEAFDPGIL